MRTPKCVSCTNPKPKQSDNRRKFLASSKNFKKVPRSSDLEALADYCYHHPAEEEADAVAQQVLHVIEAQLSIKPAAE